MFRVLPVGRMKGLANAGTAFAAAVLLFGCSGVGRTNYAPPTADAQVPAVETVHETNTQAAASSGDELEEVVTTGQHRRPPPRTRPGQGPAWGHLGAPAAAPAADAYAASGGGEAPPAPTETLEKPRYDARLTHSVITREHDEVLAVAISTKLSANELRKLISAHLKSVASTDGRGTSSAAPEDAHGSLETAVWYQFAFILAKITRCPDFIDCGGSAPQARSNDPLIWDWSLTAKKWDASRTGNIIVTFFGDQSAGGKFEQGIAAMPPLEIEVSVERDLSYWNGVAKQLSDLFSQFKTILITLGAIAAILVAWRKKLWGLLKPK
jgi:hypothetical protein